MTQPSLAAPRTDGRRPDELRPVRFRNGIAPYATGSTLIEWGNTRVICAVTVADGVPRWMKEQQVRGGWLTAEYSMLPYSTLTRKARDISRGKLDGRSQEIQRLIGRSLRAAVKLDLVGDRTFWVDCDVLQADGGTRTASITGGYVALALAIRRLVNEGRLVPRQPLLSPVAAVSLGVVRNEVLLDLCYEEDVTAAVDLNLVMNGSGECIELQGTGEQGTFSPAQLETMVRIGGQGVQTLLRLQTEAIESDDTPTDA